MHPQSPLLHQLTSKTCIGLVAMKKVFPLALILAAALAAVAQNVPSGFDISNYGVKIEPDRRVILVLATIDAARSQNATGENVRLINTKLSAAGTAFRGRMDSDLTVPDDLRQKISTFLARYKKQHPDRSDAELVTPFVAMAYSLAQPPDLGDTVVTSDLPGELLDVLDFAPLVREFYRRSGISAKLDQYLRDYQAASDPGLRSSTRDMVSEILDYLHTKPQTVFAERVKIEADKAKKRSPALKSVEIREHDRRFLVVPEMLAPAGNVQFLNVRDDYYVVVPPDTDLTVSDARRAFIQYVVDAIVLTNAKDVSTVLPGVKLLLDGRRKIDPNISPDAYLAISRSLVAAIDAREAEFSRVDAATAIARQKLAGLKTDDQKRAVTAELQKFKDAQADETALRLSEDYEKGAVLDFYFAQQLRGMEASGFDIAASMRDMLLSLDTAKESDRLTEFAEARKRGQAAREARKTSPTPTEIAIVENPVTTRLFGIQKTIEAKGYSKAAADLEQLRKDSPNDPRIYYNIGRVATLQLDSITDADEQAKKLIEAKDAYVKVLDTSTPTTDRALLSLTYVALARIYEFYNQKEMSLKLYDQAIAIADVPGGAYAQAIAGKQRLLKNP
jgi:tetratricopeptide (TPR) repeat protein